MIIISVIVAPSGKTGSVLTVYERSQQTPQQHNYNTILHLHDDRFTMNITVTYWKVHTVVLVWSKITAHAKRWRVRDYCAEWFQGLLWSGLLDAGVVMTQGLLMSGQGVQCGDTGAVVGHDEAAAWQQQPLHQPGMTQFRPEIRLLHHNFYFDLYRM